MLNSDFLSELKTFLGFDGVAVGAQATVCDDESNTQDDGGSQHIDLRTFVDMWKRACDVPPNLDQARDARHRVIEVMDFINTFRNRYAHVPFPYDPLEMIADALETVTAQLFLIAPTAWSAESVLTGGIVRNKTMWRGGLLARYRGQELPGLNFVFPARKPNEVWLAEPFVHIDKNKRPYVLTRLKNADTGTWEYTRYRAEANAVLTHDDEAMLRLVPAPTEQDYQHADDIESPIPTEEAQRNGQLADSTAPPEGAASIMEPKVQSPDPARSFSDAIQAIRDGEYDEAILFFENLVQQRPDYHIGSLRLGHAKREKAARLRTDDPEQAIKLLRSAIEAFTKATGHRDPEYSATAYYERSKAYHRMCTISSSDDRVQAAHADANEACRRSSDTRYQTWLEYLERLMPLPPGK